MKSLELMGDDVLSVIAQYIPNTCRAKVVLPKVLRELEVHPRLFTNFVTEMELTKRRYLPYGDCLRIEYPIARNCYGSVFKVELHVFKTLHTRSQFMHTLHYINHMRLPLYHEVRRQRFSFKSQSNKRKYYVLLQKFTITTLQ